jgi:uncharacterized protein
MVDYLKVGELLASKGILTAPAELHGQICGQLGAGATQLNVVALRQMLDLADLPDILVQLSSRLFEETKASLASGTQLIEPLLPDDEEELVLRLEAVARWCDGFNMGFASIAGVETQAGLPEEASEVLGDFARIAELDVSDADDDKEADEANYMEIVEYIRIAATSVCMHHEGTLSPAGAAVELH